MLCVMDLFSTDDRMPGAGVMNSGKVVIFLGRESMNINSNLSCPEDNTFALNELNKPCYCNIVL